MQCLRKVLFTQSINYAKSLHFSQEILDVTLTGDGDHMETSASPRRRCDESVLPTGALEQEREAVDAVRNFFTHFCVIYGKFNLRKVLLMQTFIFHS